MLLVMILVILSSGANILGTYMFQPILDNYTTAEGFPNLYKMIILEASIYLIGAFSTLGYTQIMARLAQKVVLEMRKNMHLMVVNVM